MSKPCQGTSGIDSACAYCSIDMDMDFFCTHPDVTKDHPFGLYINRAREAGRPCGPKGKLFEKRDVK